MSTRTEFNFVVGDVVRRASFAKPIVITAIGDHTFIGKVNGRGGEDTYQKARDTMYGDWVRVDDPGVSATATPTFNFGVGDRVYWHDRVTSKSVPSAGSIITITAIGEERFLGTTSTTPREDQFTKFPSVDGEWRKLPKFPAQWRNVYHGEMGPPHSTRQLCDSNKQGSKVRIGVLHLDDDGSVRMYRDV